MRRRSNGFTLIELVVVMIIVGLLAMIAIPRYSRIKSRAYVAALQSDLKNLVTLQEAYFQAAQTYYDGPIPAAGLDFVPTAGVTLTLSDVSATGWAATATHTAAPDRKCAIYIGTAAAPPPATTEHQITCQ